MTPLRPTSGSAVHDLVARAREGLVDDASTAVREQAATAHLNAAGARQRAPLPEVLQACRIGNTMLWDRMTARVRGTVNLRSLGAFAEVARARRWAESAPCGGATGRVS